MLTSFTVRARRVKQTEIVPTPPLRERCVTKLDVANSGEYHVFTESPSVQPSLPVKMKALSSARKSRHGFTLLELMVVLTITVLLASISMPAYNLAKKRAYWAKTPGQMAKVVTAFHAYAADHNSYFPPAYFPQGADSAQSTLSDDVSGNSGWLNSTIYTQMYPDNSEANQDTKSESTNTSKTAKTTKKRNFDSDQKGEHLKDTVFEVQASVLANPKDDNLYNHSFLLNRSLATERMFKQDEFAPRKSDLFTDLSAIMLLTEGEASTDFNSINFENAGGKQLEQGFKRYDKQFIHVGYMDGRVERLKEKDFPKSPEEDMGKTALSKDAAFLFWRGVSRKEYESLTNTGTGRVNY